MNIPKLRIDKDSLTKILLVLVKVSVFYLTTHDLYLTILVEVFKNNVLAENTYFTNHLGWAEHRIIVLKPANKYKIIRQCYNFENILIDGFLLHPIIYQAKVS